MSYSEVTMVMARATISAYIIILIGGFASGSLHAKAAERAKPRVPQCEPSYPVSGVALTRIPKGAAGEFIMRPDLQSVSVVEGHPKREGELIPYSQKGTGGSIVIYNDLDVGAAGENWLSCNYGSGSEVRIYYRLPTGTKRCTMKYKPDVNPKYEIIDSYDCR